MVAGDEDVIKYDYRLTADRSKRRFARIDAFALIAAVVAGLTAENQGHAGRVDRSRTDHGIVFGAFIHGRSRHHEDLMRVNRARHVKLAPADDDSIVPSFDDVDVLIRIRLVRRALGSIALGIGHGTDHHAVFILDADQPLFEALEVRSP